MSDTALVVMARYPEPGKTKTRLARSIGGEAAADLYQAFLTDLAWRFAGALAVELHWAYTPTDVDYRAFVSNLSPTYARQMHCFAQQGADLGERLHHVFQWTQQHGFKRTIVISSDSPQISTTCVEQAQATLDSADVVLGPAEDGGYYLIAMREPHDVFSGIPMSTDVVCQMTVDSARRQGLQVTLIEKLFDIDELPDLLRLDELLRTDSSLAPATAAQLLRTRILS